MGGGTPMDAAVDGAQGGAQGLRQYDGGQAGEGFPAMHPDVADGIEDGIGCNMGGHTFLLERGDRGNAACGASGMAAPDAL
jgi:hypothetical protein